MSERGVFAVDRGVFDHPKFKDEKRPKSKLEAWLWLLANAAWKTHRRRVSGKDFDLKRGQLVASTRFLAAKWQWSEPRVRRFLTVLKTDADSDAEIDTHTDAGVTVITIRKYTEYQRISLPRDADKDAAREGHTDAQSTQQRRKGEDKEDRESSVAKATGAARQSDVVDLRKQVFDIALPALLAQAHDERQARPIIGRWRKLTGNDDAALLVALQGAARAKPADLVEWMAKALSAKPPPLVRKNGTGWVVMHGSAEYQAWRDKAFKENSAERYKFPDKPGHEAHVPARWPSQVRQ